MDDKIIVIEITSDDRGWLQDLLMRIMDMLRNVDYHSPEKLAAIEAEYKPQEWITEIIYESSGALTQEQIKRAVWDLVVGVTNVKIEPIPDDTPEDESKGG